MKFADAAWSRSVVTRDETRRICDCANGRLSRISNKLYFRQSKAEAFPFGSRSIRQRLVYYKRLRFFFVYLHYTYTYYLLKDHMPTIYDSDEQTMITTEVCGTSCASRTEGIPALDSRGFSREKIVIRARCKDYVTKQRTVRRTLACFSQPDSDDVQDTVIGEGAGLTPTPNKNKNKNKIREGRIEKPISKHEQEGKLTKAFLTNHCPEIYTCPCSGSDSTTCKLCAFLRLADKFCAIVIARQDAIDRSGLASESTME